MQLWNKISSLQEKSKQLEFLWSRTICLIAISSSKKKYPIPKGYGKKLNHLHELSEVEVWANGHWEILIPSDDEELQLRIIFVARYGIGAHRGYTTTCNVIKDKLTWQIVVADIKTFVQGCLTCLLSGREIKIPRPLVEQEHAKEVGDIFQFHYMYIGEWTDGK